MVLPHLFHCAHFAMTVYPQVKKELIDTGKVGCLQGLPLDRSR